MAVWFKKLKLEAFFFPLIFLCKLTELHVTMCIYDITIFPKKIVDLLFMYYVALKWISFLVHSLLSFQELDLGATP